MKRLFAELIFFILFWLLFFALCRTVFAISVYPLLQGKADLSLWFSFLYALPMDVSTAAYIGILPLLLFILLFIFKKVPANSKAYTRYLILFIIIIAVFTIIDFNVYREWGSKLNLRAFQTFFNSPHLGWASISSSPIMLSLIIGLALIFAGSFLTIRTQKFMPPLVYPGLAVRLILSALLLLLQVVALRGGLSNSPLTVSSVYFSNNQTLNHIAINTEWNLVRDIIDRSKNTENPYRFMADEKAKKICDSLLTSKDSTVKVLSVNKPNIVLIILESFTADIIAALGGEKNVTPFIDSLIKESILFSNIYASGPRTDVGFISIHTGFPSQAATSILHIPQKALKLPSLSSSFFENGYNTSFYYGGETEFFNFRSFLLGKNYNRLTDIRSFSKKELNSKWGAHDDIVLKRMLQDLKDETEPFFSVLMTLSNHEPFEFPGKPKFPGNDLSNKFRSTAYYTDESLKEFFNAAAKEEWYKNTLFVLVADHGHRLPMNRKEIRTPERTHIPLIFFGKPLKENFKGKVLDVTGSQGDVAATLLAQLRINHSSFYWSKNLLNPSVHSFAFNSFDNGFTWIEGKEYVSFDNENRRLISAKGSAGKQALMLEKGKAFLQHTYQQYLLY